MVKTSRGEHLVPHAHQTNDKGESNMDRYAAVAVQKHHKAETGSVMPLSEAMREVHAKVPKNVVKTGKTGAAKESMLRAIAFSKAGEGRKSGIGTKSGHKKTGKNEWVG